MFVQYMVAGHTFVALLYMLYHQHCDSHCHFQEPAVKDSAIVIQNMFMYMENMCIAH